MTTAKRVSDLTQFTISRINGTDTANIVSPSGKFLTQTFGTSTLKLEELPSEDAVFALEQLDDQFVKNKKKLTKNVSNNNLVLNPINGWKIC